MKNASNNKNTNVKKKILIEGIAPASLSFLKSENTYVGLQECYALGSRIQAHLASLQSSL